MSDVTAKIVTPPPKPEPDTRRVVLEMPYDVAVTLRDLVGGYIGEDTRGTYREHTDMLWHALDSAGVELCSGQRFEAGRFAVLRGKKKTTSTE